MAKIGAGDFTISCSIGTTTDSTAIDNNWLDDTYISQLYGYDQYTYPTLNYYQSLSETDELRKQIEELRHKLAKGENPMKTLFNVVAVDLDGNIILDEKTVAEDTDEAKFNADVSSIIREKNLKPKDVTVLVLDLGAVKVRKEIQEVKLIKE